MVVHTSRVMRTPAPDTVNPSLWRNAQLIKRGGLFKVVDRLWQVRGQDLSNLTIVEGDTGLILMDPLVSPESARAAWSTRPPCARATSA